MSRIKSDKVSDIIKMQKIINLEDPQSKLIIDNSDTGEFNGLLFINKSIFNSIYYTKRIIFLDASHLRGKQKGLL